MVCLVFNIEYQTLVDSQYEVHYEIEDGIIMVCRMCAPSLTTAQEVEYARRSTLIGCPSLVEGISDPKLLIAFQLYIPTLSESFRKVSPQTFHAGG